MSWIIWVSLLIAAAMAVWNFVPAVRERLRGFTTVLDGSALAAGAMPIYWTVEAGVEGLKASEWRAWVPTDWQPYLLMLIPVWFIIKRLMTRTPVGGGS